MLEFITGDNIPQAYLDGIWRLRISGKQQESRNGPVIAIPNPIFLEIKNPWERVLVDDARQPNPYFHLAEFVWMMSGSNDAKWISKYNKRMMEYSDDGETFKAAYGHRWRTHFYSDQIREVVRMLSDDRTTRRAVIGMWDSQVDLEHSKDIPCNTHIYFRVRGQCLDMTVCNRSNDFIWGMMGANAVHMTMLQELIAASVGLSMGRYCVFTNNLHIYKSVPNYDEIMKTVTTNDIYRKWTKHVPLLHAGEERFMFVEDCEDFVSKTDPLDAVYQTEWFNAVFLPMMKAYENRLNGKTDTFWLNRVEAEDWREAGLAWKRWRDGSVS